MTPDRAWKLSEQTVTVAFSGGPYSEAELRKRLVSLMAEALLDEDWRVMPEDRREDPEPDLLTPVQTVFPLFIPVDPTSCADVEAAREAYEDSQA